MGNPMLQTELELKRRNFVLGFMKDTPDVVYKLM